MRLQRNLDVPGASWRSSELQKALERWDARNRVPSSSNPSERSEAENVGFYDFLFQLAHNQKAVFGIQL